MPSPTLHLFSSKPPGVRVMAEVPAAEHSQSLLLRPSAEAVTSSGPRTETVNIDSKLKLFVASVGPSSPWCPAAAPPTKPQGHHGLDHVVLHREHCLDVQWTLGEGPYSSTVRSHCCFSVVCYHGAT